MMHKPRNFSIVRVGARLALALSLIGFVFAVNAPRAAQLSEQDLTQIVRVEPTYPRRAAERGLEGYVIVEYTVTTTGSTRDVTVIESTLSIFDSSAIRAAEKFKYQPRVEDGRPVAVNGVRYRFDFDLAN
jgi:TonB family protein